MRSRSATGVGSAARRFFDGFVAEALLAEEPRKILGLAKVAVDRGLSHVGDVIQRLEGLHHHLAHDM